MRFHFIDNILDGYSINLEALLPDTNLYSTLLFQHSGVFYADANRFGNERDCTGVFIEFLQLAKRHQTSIAVTPEYSCPWNTVRWILSSEDNWPALSKLWALGCESITPNELRQLRDEQGENIIIHFDDEALIRGVNHLVNPLCYFFVVTEVATGAQKLMMLVQFKTEHMGVWTNDIEQERYIPGNEIYVLRNNLASIALFTIICSEADNFQISTEFKEQLDYRWDANSFIILNIQMNPNPSAQFFTGFRNSILEYANKDIITLNWSSDSRKRNGEVLIPYSKSSITYLSADMEFADETKFINNHANGLYYTNRQQKRHVYFLNGRTNVFLVVHRKPISGGVNPSMLRRNGPQARSNFSWDPASSTFLAAPAMLDGFEEFARNNRSSGTVLGNVGISMLDKERLINLTIGEVKTKKEDRNWYTVDKLHTFLLADDDIIRRFTFTHDHSSEAYRIDCLEKFDTINTVILRRADLFPVNHSAFIGNCEELMFPGPPYNYRFNLVTRDGTNKATVAFIGRNSLDNAEKVLKKLRELFDETDQSRKRVIVWYKPSVDAIEPVTELRKPTILDDTKTKSDSISK